MTSITFAVDEELKLDMKGFPWVNWSEIVREEFIKEEKSKHSLEELKRRALEIVSKSKFTEEDAELFSKKVKKSMHDDLVKRGSV